MLCWCRIALDILHLLYDSHALTKVHKPARNLLYPPRFRIVSSAPLLKLIRTDADGRTGSGDCVRENASNGRSPADTPTT